MEHFDSAYRQTRELISMRPRMGQYNYVPHVQIHVALRQRGWSRRYGEHVICHMCQMYFLVYFLTLFAEYAQQGLCNGRMSVRLSVCLSVCPPVPLFARRCGGFGSLENVPGGTDVLGK